MIPKLQFTGRIASLLLGAGLAALTPSSFGTVVDNFNDNVKTDWRDFSFGVGGSTEVDGQLKFAIPAAGQPLFAAATKTSDTYTLADGKTIELRADMISGNSKDSFAILSWTPDSQNVSALAGYSIAKSSTDILITKGINKYFHNEATDAVKNENITLVLILTQIGADVHITAKVLDKDANNAVIWEKSYVDTPAADILRNGTDSPAAPYTGPGKLTLMEYEDFDPAGPASYEVIFDNAEAFVLENSVVDNFDDNTKTAWTDFTFGVGASIETDGQMKFQIPAAGQALFFASTKTTRTYEFKDGEKIEFRVDMVSGNSKDSFAILSWIPTSQNVSALAGYSIVKSSTDILITKGINRYFHNQAIDLKNENITLALTLERRGENVVINGRAYDKDAGNAVIFDQTYIDTPAADVMRNGTDSPAAPFSGSGHFVLMEYEDFASGGPDVYEVIFDNAWAASPPLPANTPPVLSQISPDNFVNFVAANATVSFHATDDKPLQASQISITLNGTKYTTANGLTVVSDNAVGNAQASLLSKLEANKTYTAVLEVTDAEGLKASSTIFFDTFAPTSFTIEMEDYNFESGRFIDNPVITPVDAPSDPNSYRYQVATPEVDYHNTYNRSGGTYRDGDFVSHRATLDFKRPQYTGEGLVDYDTGRARTGEWQNYTRTFPAANYQIYLRESLFNVPTAETVLEKVNGDPADPSAPVEVLGSFIGVNSGALYRNVPLTDATGANVAVVRLDGVSTLRVRQVTADPGDGNLFQNYLIFIPADGNVVNRPRVVALVPTSGSTAQTIDLHVGATLQDRDTTVNVPTVELFLDGTKVTPVVTTPSAGTTVVDYAVTPLPPSGSTHDASLRFTDSSGARVTNNWSFTVSYVSVNPANRAGTTSDPGFNVRVVQAPANSGLENSLQRAENQLTPNSSIPEAFDIETTGQVINYSELEGGSQGYFANDVMIPGLTEENGTDDIAMEATAYLQLPAGVIRFGVRSDDGFKLSAGAGLHDQSPVLDFRNGGTADQTVDVLVPEAGAYPFRLLWYERGGGQHVEFFTVDPSSGDRTLVNDPEVAGSIKAFRNASVQQDTVTLHASASITGPFAQDAGATVDQGNKTITVTPSGTARFYLVRSSAGAATRIQSITQSGGTITIRYGAP